jgi:hypothetical protein
MVLTLRIIRWLDVPLICCLLFLAGCLSETGYYRRVDDSGSVVPAEGPVRASEVKSGSKYLPCLPDGTPIQGEKPIPWWGIAGAYLLSRFAGSAASFLPPPFNTIATAVLGGSGFIQRAAGNVPDVITTGAPARTAGSIPPPTPSG